MLMICTNKEGLKMHYYWVSGTNNRKWIKNFFDKNEIQYTEKKEKIKFDNTFSTETVFLYFVDSKNKVKADSLLAKEKTITLFLRTTIPVAELCHLIIQQKEVT